MESTRRTVETRGETSGSTHATELPNDHCSVRIGQYHCQIRVVFLVLTVSELSIRLTNLIQPNHVATRFCSRHLFNFDFLTSLGTSTLVENNAKRDSTDPTFNTFWMQSKVIMKGIHTVTL